MPNNNDDENSKEGALAQAMQKALDDTQWGPLLRILGIEGDEKGDRLVRLLVVHLMLDRAVTAVVALRLVGPSSRSFTDIEAEVANLPMSNVLI